MSTQVDSATGPRCGAAATDEHGTDLALHGQPGDVLIHPTNATAKRVVADEAGFFTPLLTAMRSSVEELRRSAG